MCGFAGFFANEILTQGQSDQVKQGTATLSKRGPDADGFFSDQQVALGHRRLSIIDTSEQGTQPMSTGDDRYQIVFNGEIYNYISLRQELVTKGFTFKSETDTEVLLNGYIAWGAEVLQRLNGFFAFAIYDSQLREVFVARDRFGIKPLVYAVLADGIAFGSEIKSILPLIGKKEIDREALNLYFELTYVPSPKTIFKGISKLAPGKYLRISSTGIESHQYYKVPYREEASINMMTDGISALRPLLKKAVTDRLVADVPVGTFLSGGIDSSVITALAAQEHHQIDSFSIGFRDNPYYDETEYALAVAKKWKTNHHVFSLTSEDLLEHVFSAIDYLDEPFADSSALPVFILSKLTREHVTVALSGDGADEIFSGYNKHEAYHRSKRASLSNRLIRSVGSLAKILPQSRDSKVADLARKFSKYHDLLQLSGPDKYWMLATFTKEQQRRGLLKPDHFQSTKGFSDQLLQGFRADDLNSFLHKDVQLVLPGDMLRKVDSMSMTNGLEVRVPFLDHQVVDLAFDLHQSLKLNEKGRKQVLLEAFRNELPAELFNRSKQGFEVPLLDWMRNELKSTLDELVFNRERIEAQGLFNFTYLMIVRQRLHGNNPGDVPILVWQLFVFQRWWNNYFLG